MKIAVLTDVHGNLPALQAVLRAIRREDADAIFRTGDAIGIGPFPAECLELLLSTSVVHLTCGNHDAWFSSGIPEPLSAQRHPLSCRKRGNLARTDWHWNIDELILTAAGFVAGARNLN